MALNLIRNSRVFFTLNVNSQGVVQATGFNPTNTWEIQVLDGFSFSQNTNTETITLSEAGVAPVRGQRSFNTSLAPVDFSFSTYLRPYKSTNVKAEESVLWNAFSSAGFIGSAASNPGWTEGDPSTVSFVNSNKHQLQKFGLLIVMDATTFIIDNACLNEATIDFGIDAIGTIAWTGMGTALRQATTLNVSSTAVPHFSYTGSTPGYAGSSTAKITTAKYIANKLSTATVSPSINGYRGSTDYTVAITGGQLSISNNITYLTPANLGTVNLPFTSFTGARSVTGNLTAYLKTGSLNTAALLSDMLATASADDETKYTLEVALGGKSNLTRVDFTMPGAMLQIPTVSSEQVISTTINFTGQGYTGSNSAGMYDIEQSNELDIRYYAE